MTISDAIAGFALVVALLALWQSSRANKAQQTASAWLAHLSEIVEVESRLGDLPEALRFHGLAVEDLAAVGLTPQEFAYLLNSFTLGATWDQLLNPNLRTPFAVGNYRHECSS